MKNFTLPSLNKEKILALGAESEGIFAFYQRGKIFISDNFGDLTNENNFSRFKKEINKIFKKHRLEIILTDLHPLYNTTIYGKILSQKFNLKLINVQHHLAHIFSALGDQIILNNKYNIPDDFFGIACDGTGYGLDGKIWGGEAFAISNFQFSISKQIPNYKLQIKRIGHLENQTMIGGDLAVKEPARMLISILSKFLNKKEVYKYAKKYYSQNEFELLYNQLRQNFNCQETSSAGRVLDAVSVLLGFSDNQRNYKHEPIDLLEKNSTQPYSDLKPKISKNPHPSLRFTKGEGLSPFLKGGIKGGFLCELQTTPLFEYLIKNLHKDKKHLAATAQLYIAQGLYEIIKPKSKKQKAKTFLAGGIANNKIISNYLESKDVYASKKIPRGDAGLSFGQIIYYLLSKK